MSGLDELFPDAVEPSSAPVTVGPPGLGRASLIVGLIAVVGDAAALVADWLIFDAGQHDVEGLASLSTVFTLSAIVFVSGLGLGIAAIVVGILAVVRRRGRRSGIWGIACGTVVVIERVLLAVTLALAFAAVGNAVS